MSFSIATDDNFKELISEGVCIVDFCGTHCGPCRSLYPHLLEIETKVPFIHLVKTNIDICKKNSCRVYDRDSSVYFSFKRWRAYRNSLGKARGYHDTGSESILWKTRIRR